MSYATATVQEHVIGTPLSALRGRLDEYHGFYEALAQPICRLQVPRAQVLLIVGFGDNLQLSLVGSQSPPKALQSFVVGINASPLVTEHWGIRHCIEIPLSPEGAHQLFQGAAAEFSGEVVALEDIWGQDANRLTARVRGQSSWLKRFALIDQELIEKLAQSNRSIRPEIRWAWNQLKLRGGCLPIRHLSRAIGWSDRYFAKCFKEAIGITPKIAARQIRFTQACHLLRAEEAQPLNEIALTCGYSDQSHFTREFHTFSGYSPKAFQNGNPAPNQPAALADT